MLIKIRQAPKATVNHTLVTRCIAAITFSIFLMSCGIDIEDPTPPRPPVWVQKSLPEAWPERGIDAHESGGIYLEWEPSPEEDIVAYRIYRATWYDVNDSLGEYDLLIRLEMEALPVLEYIDRSVHLRTQYFFKLKAEGGSGNFSTFSDSVSFSLLPQLSSALMSPNGQTGVLDTNRILSWSYTYTIEMEEYNITLLTENGEFVHREILLPGNYIGGTESWQIPARVSLDSNQSYQWRIDTAAKYVNDRETAGSESAWATFLYAGR